MDYKGMSVKRFVQEVCAGNVNLDEFYARLFDEVRELNRRFGFFITISETEARKDIQKKPKGILAGLPVSVKDNICTKHIQTTAGSRILKGYIPVFDSTVVSRVRSQGGIIIGKTTMDEFGFGTFSTNSGYSIPRNPHDVSRSCGGSSGGAAGLVSALDYPHIALGQSTGGSISCPASFCGVVGLTPTYGRVSRYGLIDYGNSLDKIGPIGKTVEDVALMLSVISGYDQKDPTTIEKDTENYLKYIRDDIKGLRIAVPREYFGEGVDEGVKNMVWDAIKLLEENGATYKEVSLPSTELGIATYYIIATSEASTNLAKFCGMRYGAEEEISGDFNEYFSRIRTEYFGEEAKRRILIGTYARMAGYRDHYYLKAMKIRTLIIEEFKSIFRENDVIIAPTMPCIAPKFSEIERMQPLEIYMMDVLTVNPNLAGLPCISVPCGNLKGMPVGMHIIADHLREGKIIRTAYFYERNR
ncbi:MAG TPA: Asp-tRNA(Asn)/Glu-tRNA(Gln) amidotransferase subunit GatA [Candidatus Altiarchaeales archaeon]|nr:Asp-tRNA(Asn)/Glu-tRNA(Gln) amidotransferase subunit GatA [Candidatus Altiarchaeales archaeon]